MLRMEMDFTYNATHEFSTDGICTGKLGRNVAFEDKLIAAMMTAAGLEFA